MKRYKLSELCSITNGKSNTIDSNNNGKYCFFDRSQIVKHSDKYLFDCEAIIIPGEGTDFIPKYFHGKFDLHQRCYKIESNNPNVNTKYLYYNILKNKDYFSLVATGSTVPSLRLSNFQNFELTIHDLPTQQHIVNTIGSIDDLIENLKNQNKRLIKIGLSKINNLNENKTKNLLEIVNFVRGKEIGSLNYKHSKKDNMINYLRVADLLSLGNTYVNKDKKLNIAQFDDILCAFDGTPGRNNIGLLGAYCSGIYNLKCKEIDKGLVYFEINSDLNQKIIRMFSRGTTILHASKAINFLQYVEVSLEEKQSLNILFKKIVQNKKKIECLKFAKHNLLNKFF
ncbi:restriction endonuclease subunit S [Metamycoplasma hominis]|uniref:restriction endonuclease subunit S n=2 Tax=Metamycoplasma hominis TaxID=2098 RepID=UPI003CFAD665